jgi:lysozyme family protein
MADPNIAIAITISPSHEGGFQDDPKDKGNWTGGEVGAGVNKGTNRGISAAVYPDLDIKNLTEEETIALYKESYWKQFYSQIESQEIANKLFDLGVLFGVGTAVGYLQSVLGITQDHAFGPATLQAVNNADPDSLLKAYKTIFVTHALDLGAKNPNMRGDVPDWIRRINS